MENIHDSLKILAAEIATLKQKVKIIEEENAQLLGVVLSCLAKEE